MAHACAILDGIYANSPPPPPPPSPALKKIKHTIQGPLFFMYFYRQINEVLQVTAILTVMVKRTRPRGVKEGRG